MKIKKMHTPNENISPTPPRFILINIKSSYLTPHSTPTLTFKGHASTKKLTRGNKSLQGRFLKTIDRPH